MSLCALCFVPSSFPCRPAPRITKSLVNRRPYSVCRRNTPRAALPPQEEADWIIVDVSLRGLDENARPLASTIQHDGRALVYKALHNQPAELSLVLCSDAEILELNTAWRGKEKPTDVLSFPQNDEVVRAHIFPFHS